MTTPYAPAGPDHDPSPRIRVLAGTTTIRPVRPSSWEK